MRRSICYCDPNYAVAGHINTWKFLYTTSISLSKGTILRFELLSDGRDIDWEIPTTNIKKSKNVIFAKLENKKILQAKTVETEDSFFPLYEFVLPEKVQSGSTITFVIGSTKDQEKARTSNGTQAQTYAQRRRQFHLYVDTSGKGRFEEPEVFSMDVRGGKLSALKILAPSFVVRNKRFDLIVRCEDEFGNLTNDAPEDTLIELTYHQLRENLNWKLFVPETGFITLPNLYFNEPGIYTIELHNMKTKEVFYSPPIKCFSKNDQKLYWGMLHGESERIDSTENIESCLRHFRDDKAINFISSSSFEDNKETPNDTWKMISNSIAEFNEPDRFVTFLGFQWQGNRKSEGLREFIYSKDNKPLLRKKETRYNALKKIYRSFSPKEMISIPGFTMGKGMGFDFKDFNPEFERVVEIYNSWGSSECTKKEGNPRPIKSPKRTGIQEAQEGSIQKALQENKRFGFVGGGLDDRGAYADFYDDDQMQYSPGFTAIIAPEHTRAALFDALYKRSCYATTGPRIILGIHLAGTPMGSETSTADKHGLLYNRHITGFVAGTDTLKTIEIIRNGKVIQTYKPNDYHFEFAYDDMVNLDKVAIDAKDKKPPFVYYYLRVTQKDSHMAWSSPIWVDYVPGKPLKKSSKSSSKNPKKSKSNELQKIEEVDTIKENDKDNNEGL